MRIGKALMAAAAIGLVVSGTANAQVRYLSVDWYDQVATIHFTIAGTTKTVAQLQQATGYLDGTYDHHNTPGGTFIPRMFCIDVFELAQDTNEPIDNHEYDVYRYTQANGNTGWDTPAHGTDHWRDEGSVQRTAYLANKYGKSWLTQGGANRVFDRCIALNVAMWQAAYGARFSLDTAHYLHGGLPSLYSLNRYNELIADYNHGSVDNNYTWFDSASNDSTDVHQDFMTPVPEPGTLMLLGAGLLGSGLAFRRRRQG